MKKIFNIQLNAARKKGGIHQETRQIVLKNFLEYNPKDVFNYDRLSCGLLIRVDENDRYMLLKSTCYNWGSYETYVVCDKNSLAICVEITLVVSDKYELWLAEGMSDILTITFTELKCEWHCSNYEFLDKKTYSIRLAENAKPFVCDVETDEELGFSIESHGTLYVSEKIVSDVKNPEAELSEDKWKGHRIFFSLF